MIVTVEFDQQIELEEILSEVLGYYDVSEKEKENPELFIKNHEKDLVQDCIDELDTHEWNIKYNDGYEDDYRNQIKEELEEDYILDYIKEFFNN